MSDKKTVAARVSPEMADLIEYLAFVYRTTNSEIINRLLGAMDADLILDTLADIPVVYGLRESPADIREKIYGSRASLGEG